MKRTKEWWGRLTKEERSKLVGIEKGPYCWGCFSFMGEIICLDCQRDRQKLIAKANAKETP